MKLIKLSVRFFEDWEDCTDFKIDEGFVVKRSGNYVCVSPDAPEAMTLLKDIKSRADYYADPAVASELWRYGYKGLVMSARSVVKQLASI